MRKILTLLIVVLLICVACFATACDNRPKVTIYTSTEDYNVAYMQKCLNEQFPNYKIIIEDSLSTSEIAAKVIAEGASSDIDIVYAEEYGWMEKMIAAGVLDSIEGDYDLTKYVDDAVPTSTKDYVLPAIRTGGGIIVNTKILTANGLSEPASYQDLLAPGYKDLICMASPASSGTGYMFYYSLVKAWGEDAALGYFASFTDNVLEYTTSGSKPVGKLKLEEVAVGFGMISQAVDEINNGNTDLKILFFEEGAPYNLYGNAIVKGKKARTEVKEVMDYLDSFYTNASNQKYYPEPVLKNTNYNVANFPENINYADMVGNNLTNKEALLVKWNAMLESK